MSAPPFARQHRPTPWQLVVRLVRSASPPRPDRDFSEVQRWAKLQIRADQLSRRARPDLVGRLDQEIRRYHAEEFRLEQVTALRQVHHLLPLVERDLPQFDRRRSARAAGLIAQARTLPDPETLRRLEPCPLSQKWYP